MQHRNVLSPISRLLRLAIYVTALASSQALKAETTEGYRLLSFLAPPQSVIPEIRPEDALIAHEIPPSPEPAAPIDLTVHADDLWDRIRNGFAMTDLNDNLVLHYQQWYQNRPDALRRMVERSRPFLHHIVEELEARGMPTELALLPMVESSFNPLAYSRAHAAGLWQFIPATGKRFNLEQNWWQDERRDIVASTSAALEYLQAIYEMQGDWHLALASYNWGEGAVRRAVEKNEARGLPTDYASLNMPQETRHYVPKLQALKNIFGNPLLVSRLGLPKIANRPYFATLETQKPLDVRTAARLANISLDEFQRLNPSHNRPVIKPTTPVVVPAEKLNTFQENLRLHDAALSEWRGYTLKSVDHLSNIASQFGISASELARVNGLPERVRLGIGTTLLVPGNGDGNNLMAMLGTDTPRQVIEPEVTPRHCSKKHGRSCHKPDLKVVKSTPPVAKAPLQGSGKPALARKPANANTPTLQAKAKPSPVKVSGAAHKPAKPENVARLNSGRRS